MPNTPRTLAELDALYADNNAGAISAQDLRDGFESIANPVSGGGFDTMPYGPDNDQVLYTGFASAITVPSGVNGTHVPFTADTQPNRDGGYLFDPQGWIQRSSTYASPDWTGETYQPGEWMLLPEGLFIVHMYGLWNFMGANDAVGNRSLYFGTVDTRAGTATDEPFDWAPVYALDQTADATRLASAMPLSGTARMHGMSGFVRVRSTKAPVAYALQPWQDSGSNMQLSAYSIIVIHRVSDHG